MLTQLTTVKARLGILETETQYDGLLNNAIKHVTVRFDHECSRTLARTENITEEFEADLTEVCLRCYPLEAISRFEFKAGEAEGWVEQPGVEYLVRRRCVLSLQAPLGNAREQARVTYTGGYVLPGTALASGQVALPDDLEQAAVEQVAFWFQTRDKLGVERQWPSGGPYQQFADLDLLPSVRAVLRTYERTRV